MSKDGFKQSLEQARQQLAQAVQHRDLLNLEVMRLQQIVNALAISSRDAEMQEHAQAEWQVYVELTQAIEAIVNGSPIPLTPVQVRDTLYFYGYNIGRYANPMAMIHQTLKRLAADRRIRVIPGGQYTRTLMYDALLNAQNVR